MFAPISLLAQHALLDMLSLAVPHAPLDILVTTVLHAIADTFIQLGYRLVFFVLLV
jgi:hypothetical protein